MGDDILIMAFEETAGQHILLESSQRHHANEEARQRRSKRLIETDAPAAACFLSGTCGTARLSVRAPGTSHGIGRRTCTGLSGRPARTLLLTRGDLAEAGQGAADAFRAMNAAARAAVRGLFSGRAQESHPGAPVNPETARADS